jgi:hypothetical protein
MTSRFSRPAKAVSCREQIPVGTRVWHMYGIWPVSGPTEYEVASEPYTSKYGIDVVDVFYLTKQGTRETIFGGGAPLRTQKSLLDANIDKDNHYNDNYMFLSKEDAESCVRWFQLCYSLDSSLVEEEKIRTQRNANHYYYD